MTETLNRQWRLARRPRGMVTEADFVYHEEPVAQPKDGEVLVRTLYVSFDPAMRAFLHDRPSYVPPQPVGEVMRAGVVGQVVESRFPAIQPGDFVSGGFGGQDYAVTPGQHVMKVVPTFPLTNYLGVLGGTGITAYFGLLHVAQIKSGETVVISGAAGATGSTAVQISKLKGCRTIAIAGGARKCRWLTEQLGADVALDYKSGSLAARLKD